ncbi:Hypothetical predicted protein, partial [Pelobates cultripes]
MARVPPRWLLLLYFSLPVVAGGHFHPLTSMPHSQSVASPTWRMERHVSSDREASRCNMHKKKRILHKTFMALTTIKALRGQR